jgi:hypothetical protein
MRRHIAEAIRLSGIDPREIEITQGRNGHIHLRRNGRLVVCSCSPKDETIAARNIAKELRSRT